MNGNVFGVLQGSIASVGDFGNNVDLTIGSVSDGRRYTDGLIGAVQIYNHGMTTNEFETNFDDLYQDFVVPEPSVWAHALGVLMMGLFSRRRAKISRLSDPPGSRN